ncbi:hypothetical protein YPIP275_3012 [Yersinia pestis biovar Orientalis str. IP275]|uniref:Uncharacterized protein n=3 Tax=Enterobacterales TaxID=91347 RepID=A0A8E4T7G4_ECOLX|nr:hypothetical protein [Klebsiella pneumoniae]EDR30440.1 hypothetical protein YPIP275_2638 [Yersinia pestis biovar Orientalis str. IP275]QPP21468.1 hypothetical protein [Escherichia coli]AWF77254.1 hypothetical protein [Klebsiella pneumoniae]EDR32588.1 hypothetical protein YPIP275_2801 [Yersinia pestis biovar Orientalis str. IP275]
MNKTKGCLIANFATVPFALIRFMTVGQGGNLNMAILAGIFGNKMA